MKKLLALLLAMTICLSLTACFKNTNKDTETTEENTTDSTSESTAEDTTEAVPDTTEEDTTESEPESSAEDTTESDPESTDEDTTENTEENAEPDFISEITGQWKCPADDSLGPLVFTPDGKGTVGNENSPFAWKYDKDLGCYIVASKEFTIYALFIEHSKEGIRSFKFSGKNFYPAEDYEKAVEIEYQRAYDKVSSALDPKAKTELGQPIKLGDGCTLTFNSATITDGIVQLNVTFKNDGKKDYKYTLGLKNTLYELHNTGRIETGEVDALFAEDKKTVSLELLPGESYDCTVQLSKKLSENIGFVGFQFTVVEVLSLTDVQQALWIDLSEFLQ